MKSFLTLILLLLPYVVSAQIQNTSIGFVNVTANVLVSATTKMPTVQTLYDVNFVVYDGEQTQIVVDPIRNTVGTEDGAGAILITGTPNTEFTLRYTRFVEMKNEDHPTSTVIVEYILSHHSTHNQSYSTYVNQLDTKFKLNEMGEYYVWVGGNVSIANIKDGQYLGGLEIEVSYDQN